MPRIKKQIKELLCSENEDDIRLGFIMAKRIGYSVKQLDCALQWIYKKEYDSDNEQQVFGYPDIIAKEFIEFKDNLGLDLRYKCWKDDKDDTK